MGSEGLRASFADPLTGVGKVGQRIHYRGARVLLPDVSLILITIVDACRSMVAFTT
jgi:hypothetical protein